MKLVAITLWLFLATAFQVSSPDVVCTGNNDQAQIQAAVDSLPASGGTIQIARGTCSFQDSLRLPNNTSDITIKGEGDGATVLRWADGYDGILVKSSNTSAPRVGTRIYDLTLSGGTKSRHSTTAGIYATKWTGLTIERVTFVNFRNYGLYEIDTLGLGTAGWHFQQVRFTGNDQYGMFIGGGLGGLHAQSTTYDFNQIGLFITGQNAELYFNDISLDQNVYHGAQIQGSGGRFQFNGGYVGMNGRHGMLFSSGSIYDVSVKGINFYENSKSNPGNAGISIGGEISGVRITDNSFHEGPSGQSQGVALGDGIANVLILGNDFLDITRVERKIVGTAINTIIEHNLGVQIQ